MKLPTIKSIGNEFMGAKHQFLLKPFDLESLKATLQRICQLRHRVRSDEILALVTKKGALPSVPAVYPELIMEAQRQQRRLIEAEKDILHATHAEAGGCLLDLWGLPTPLVEAVALHHEPAKTSHLVFNRHPLGSRCALDEQMIA